MKRVLALIAVLAVAVPARAVVDAGILVAGAVATNPANGAVLVDTGALDWTAYSTTDCVTGGEWGIGVYISTTVGAFFEVRVLDSLGATVQSVYRGVPANDSKDFMPRFSMRIPQNGKVQVRTTSVPATFTGQAQATAQYSFAGCY